MADLVLYSVDNRVALITVNDPDRRNAVSAGRRSCAPRWSAPRPIPMCTP